MIVREILKNVDLINTFDWFNDYHDTLIWLKRYSGYDSNREKIIKKLEIGYTKWLKLIKRVIKMYNIKCFTVHDAWERLSWPTELDVRPIVGEYIRDNSGMVNAKIQKITHFVDGKHKCMELYITTANGVVPRSTY